MSRMLLSIKYSVKCWPTSKVTMAKYIKFYTYMLHVYIVTFEICPSNIFYTNALRTDNLYKMNTDLAKSFLHLPFQYRKFVTGNRWPLTYQSGRTGCRWYCQGRPSKPWPPVSHGEEEHLDMSIICYSTWPIISMFLVASVMITYRVMYFLTHQSHQCCLRDVLTSILPPVCYCKKNIGSPF